MYKPDLVKLYVLTQIAFTKLLVYSKLNPLRGERGRKKKGRKREKFRKLDACAVFVIFLVKVACLASGCSAHLDKTSIFKLNRVGFF